MRDFAGAAISSGGKVRPLVREQRVVVPAGEQNIEEDFPLTPTGCACLLALVFALILWRESRVGHCLVWFDAAIMLLQGLAGCIVLAMFFSEHPAGAHPQSSTTFLHSLRDQAQNLCPLLALAASAHRVVPFGQAFADLC